MKDFKNFIKENFKNDVWYRGYTTNTNKNEYTWITSDKNHAKQYSELNKYSYGGESIVDQIFLNENNFDLIDLYSYDMDDMISESDAEDFIEDVNIDYDYENLFDIMEDEIPLSRLVNKILTELVFGKDGIKIMENGIKTIYIKNNLL